MTFAELAEDELSFTVMSAGQVIDGASVSAAGLIVTVKLQLWPVAVVAVTTDVPTAKKEPEAGVMVTGPVPQLPTAAGVSNVTVAPLCPVVAVCVILDGQVMVQAGGAGLLAGTVESEVLFRGCPLLSLLPASAVSLVTLDVLVNSEPLAMLALTL